MRLARTDHVVRGLGLLQHAPHRVYVIAREPPIPAGVEVSEVQLARLSLHDAGDAVRHLARDELEPAARRFMIEEDAADGEQPVGLAVVHGNQVAVHLGDAIGGARIEWRRLALRRLPHLAEHLGRARLVDARRWVRQRSEEHTSELQSPMYLVCRLLLEKKKKEVNKSFNDPILTSEMS